MRRWLLLLLPAVAAAQEPVEKGLLPPGFLSPEPLTIPPAEGDPLATFREAHEKHKRGDTDGALQGYLAFLGNPKRIDLPPRYVTTVEERVKPLLAAVRALWEAAIAEYEKDRKKGLADLRTLEERYPWLPEGRAARAFADSDGLRAAIDRAKEDKQAKLLEEAIRAFPKGLFLYEAKSLLVDLGGPDLFEPDERVGGDKEKGPGEEGKKPTKKETGGIEVSED
ncbi:MAG TPA: hypothetical protein VFY93_15070 [Planctomycetota bacterium]|nr:hypothetical protein [Planctomycetota bacterium]